METLHRTLWMSHLETLQVLSLAKFKIHPTLSYLGHPGTLQMYWPFSVNEPLRHIAVFFWEISKCIHGLHNQDTAVTSLGTLWMYWVFPGPGKLQINWLGKLWMYFQCPGWYMVGTLSMSLQCICSIPAQYTTPCPQCISCLLVPSYLRTNITCFSLVSLWGSSERLETPVRLQPSLSPLLDSHIPGTCSGVDSW